MGKVFENRVQGEFTIVFTFCVIIAVGCIFGFVGKAVEPRIIVCDLDQGFLVRISVSDFDKNVQSKNLDDCQ